MKTQNKEVSRWMCQTSMGKINLLSYQMWPSVPEYSYNPEELSLPLKYLLAIKVNLSILNPSLFQLVRSSNGHFYDRRQLYLQLSGYSCTLTLSLCLSTVLPTRPFFPFHINMMTVYIFNYYNFDNKRLRTICCFTWGLAYNTSSGLLVMS